LQTKTVTLTAVASVVAIQAINQAYSAGIIVSDADGEMMTGWASWKCQDAPVPADWMTIAFNESAWSSAVSFDSNAVSHYGNNPPLTGISPLAKWIWTNKTVGTVYCRLRLN
jgi:hypothetical protein